MMTPTKLVNVTVEEVSLVKKGANRKSFYLKKHSPVPQEVDPMEVEKAQAETAEIKTALEKAVAEQTALREQIATLEKAAGEAAAATAAEKAALEASNAEAIAKAVELEKTLVIEKEAKEVSEAVQKASELFKNLPVNASELGPDLRTIRKASPEVADRIEAVLTKVDALSKINLAPIGSSKGEDKPATALEEMQKRASEMVTKGIAPTFATAFAQVLKNHPDLYAAHEAEKKSA